MKKWMRISAITTALFCGTHTYLWAFGIYEPKYEWFGFVLYAGYAFAAMLFAYSFTIEEA